MVDEVLDGLLPKDTSAAVEAAGCRLLRRAIHAKVLVRDDVSLIGSYNFLSADISGTGSRAKELSVRIEDPHLPSILIERLRGIAKREAT